MKLTADTITNAQIIALKAEFLAEGEQDRRSFSTRGPLSLVGERRAHRRGHSDCVRKYAHATADLVLTEKPWSAK